MVFNQITNCDLKWHPYKIHVKKKERIINDVNLLKEYQYLLKELWQKCEEGCKSVFKEMEDISKEK